MNLEKHNTRGIHGILIGKCILSYMKVIMSRMLRFLVDGVKRYGCSCFSNYSTVSKWIKWDGWYESHNFEKFP